MSTLSRDDLRSLFLFEKLTDDQLDWVAANGEIERYAAGDTVLREGDPATCFYGLLSGALSAGLTHELTNPAAAAVRATSLLRERVAGMRHKLALLARNEIEPGLLEQLVDVQEILVKQVANAPKLTAMQASDLEDELSD